MAHDFMPGLAGVPAAKSAISDVDGQRGILEYRGIRIEDLCPTPRFSKPRTSCCSATCPSNGT
jgi:citrate synthase